MITFICLFFPAIVSLFLYETLCKTTLSTKKALYWYAIFNLAINGGCFLIKTYVLGTGAYSLANAVTDMSPSAAFNYLVMAIPCAVILSFIASLLTKNVRIEKSEAEDEEVPCP